jgi:hypothetical protein
MMEKQRRSSAKLPQGKAAINGKRDKVVMWQGNLTRSDRSYLFMQFKIYL